MMPKWTKTSADVEEFARVHGLIGDTYPLPKLHIKTKNGNTFSGHAVGFQLSKMNYSGAYRGVVTILVGAEIVEIEYLDIDKVERVKSN
jgi:hypothetical protein